MGRWRALLAIVLLTAGSMFWPLLLVVVWTLTVFGTAEIVRGIVTALR